MSSEGPNNGQLFNSIDYAGGTDITWSSPDDAIDSNDAYASATLAAVLDQQTEGLRAQEYVFGIPAGSTINGIVVEVERSESLAAGIIDISAKLTKSSGPVGTDKAASTEAPLVDAYQTYGSSSDLWGTTWTPAEINDSSFGFEVRYDGSLGIAGTIRVDHIRITVYYTPPSGAPQMMLIGVGI